MAKGSKVRYSKYAFSLAEERRGRGRGREKKGKGVGGLLERCGIIRRGGIRGIVRRWGDGYLNYYKELFLKSKGYEVGYILKVVGYMLRWDVSCGGADQHSST